MLRPKVTFLKGVEAEGMRGLRGSDEVEREGTTVEYGVYRGMLVCFLWTRWLRTTGNQREENI